MSIQFINEAKEAVSTIDMCSFGCKRYEKDHDVWICYAKDMGELAHEEAHHHDEDDEDPFVVHQLHAWRNKFYHSIIKDYLTECPKDSNLLEIGSGSGVDAESFLEDHNVVLTDVSPDTLRRTHKRLGDKFDPKKHMLIACDGQHLPFANQQFDAAYMVATFHHFASPELGLSECYRVLKCGGKILLGVEPNKTYFKPMKWVQNILFRLSHTNTEHISKADQEMEGFSYNRLSNLLYNAGFHNVSIRPMWFLAGWLHYPSEFIYRAFRLKKRFTYPLWLEKFLVGLDELLFSIPGIKHLCWHWIVTANKKLR